MNTQSLLSLLADNPIISAVKNDDELSHAIKSSCGAVILLYGNALNVGALVRCVKQSGKACFVHIDLVEGLSQSTVAVDFLVQSTEADGMISTRPQLVRHARQRGMLTIQRFFIIDSKALDNAKRLLSSCEADIVEILPGVMPKVTRELVKSSKKPLIASGLIRDKEDVVSAISAGAVAVSSTNSEVWFM